MKRDTRREKNIIKNDMGSRHGRAKGISMGKETSF